MDYAQAQSQNGKRSTGLVVVVALHVLLGWALMNGMAHRVVEMVKTVDATMIEEIKPPPPPPPENLPPPPPKVAPPPPSFVPPPEIPVANPPPAPVITTTTVAPPPTEIHTPAPPAPTAPPAPPAAPTGVAPTFASGDARSCAPTADDYPAAAVRADATGETKVRVTIDASGAVTNVDVVKSAGPSKEHKALDKVVVAKLKACQYKPGRDASGNAVGGSFNFEYVWKLQ